MRLTATEAEEIRQIIERIGEPQTRQLLAISNQTLCRAVGQMHLQRGTVALIRERLRGRAAA